MQINCSLNPSSNYVIRKAPKAIIMVPGPAAAISRVLPPGDIYRLLLKDSAHMVVLSGGEH